VRFAEIFKTELFSKYGQKAGYYINEIYDIMNARESTCLKTGFYIREWRKNGEGK